MIALGGAVGTGLIIGSGTALRRGGPLGLLLGYSFVGYVECPSIDACRQLIRFVY